MSTYKINGIHGGILPKNEIQHLMSECLRGTTLQEHNKLIEEELVRRHLQGDRIATMRLIYAYKDVFGVIMRKPAKPPRKKAMSQKVWVKPNHHDYEDLFQDTLAVFIDSLGKYNPDCGPLENYVRGILHQRVFDWHFREFIINNMVRKDVGDDIIRFIDFIESARLDEIKVTSEVDARKFALLHEQLDKLPPRQREVLNRTVVTGWSSFEMADDLSFSEGHIRKTKKIALDRLRDSLDYEELKQLGVVR